MAIQKVQPELVDSSKDFTFANVTATSGISTGNLAITSNVSTGNLTSNGTVDFTNASNVSLGSSANLHISGGSAGQYLQTNGSGNLTWGTISTTGISNGTSNLAIPVSNGNINLTVNGNANVLVVTGTGIDVTGEIKSSGNANVGNLSTTTVNAAEVLVSGNLKVTGDVLYSNVTTLNIKDPIS